MLNKFLNFRLALFVSIGIVCSFSCLGQTQQSEIRLGAYYFDGWSGKLPGKISKSLKDTFQVRESKWGWITSTPEIVDSQINLAAQSGLSFFEFCWYYPTNDKANYNQDPVNNALNLYLKSALRYKVDFSLMVANHQGFIIGPEDWNTLCNIWINIFKEKGYVTVDGKPLLTFFTLSTLLKTFGSTDALKKAFDQLRSLAKSSGLNGVEICVCTSPKEDVIAQCISSSVDILSGYNYHLAGLSRETGDSVQINQLLEGSKNYWNKFSSSSLPYIPVITANWDPRPWSAPKNYYDNSSRYVGLSESSVHDGVFAARQWLKANPSHATKEKLAVIYAWNEYGEGAWLTPGPNDSLHLLNGLKRALQ